MDEAAVIAKKSEPRIVVPVLGHPSDKGGIDLYASFVELVVTANQAFEVFTFQFDPNRLCL